MTSFEQPQLNTGFSALRPVVEASFQPTANLLLEKYGSYPHASLRRFDTDSQAPSVRLCTTQETQARFKDEPTMAAVDLAAAALDMLPSLTDPIQVVISDIERRKTKKGSDQIVGVFSSLSDERLSHERDVLLRTIERYADVAQTDWDIRDFDLVLATFSRSASPKKATSALELVKNTCPERIMLGSLFFQYPKPPKTT